VQYPAAMDSEPDSLDADCGEIIPLTRPRRPRFGDYELLAPLARGGMCTVHLAAHVQTGERVAIKALDPAFTSHPEVTQRLVGELSVARASRHPGVVAVHAAGCTRAGVPYLVMEYLPGRSLSAIADEARLPFDAICALGGQIAASVAAMHAAGYVHCDIKPENVIVVDAPQSSACAQTKLVDFGVSRRVDEAVPEDSGIAGTPAYMAPEQWRGEPVRASDVYALGCVLYELITGSMPFAGSLPELMHAHREARPPRPSWLRDHVPPALERLVLRALAKDPRDRPTMLELARDLERVECFDRQLAIAS